MVQRALILCFLVPLIAGSVSAAELTPKTIAAFDRYVSTAERRIAREVAQPSTFLWADTLAASRKADVLRRLQSGEIDALPAHVIGLRGRPEHRP